VGTLGYFRAITVLLQTTTKTLTMNPFQKSDDAPLILKSGLEKATSSYTNSLPDRLQHGQQRPTKVQLDDVLSRHESDTTTTTTTALTFLKSASAANIAQQQQWTNAITARRNKRPKKNNNDNDLFGSQYSMRTMKKKNKTSIGTTEFGSSRIYQRGPWDGAPVVIESHHLIFFTTPKIGCTVFKMLFRRMMHIPDWSDHATNNSSSDRIHDPDLNGLRYLYDYPEHTAQSMVTSRNWTKAVFVRDPKTRLLSAYLDKAINTDYMLRHCCRHFQLKRVLPCRREGLLLSRNITFADFVYRVIPICRDPHWEAQANRIPHKYWTRIDFIGHMESIAADTKRLLERIGAWDTYGKTGWKGGSIFAGTDVSHATDSGARLREYYTPELETAVEEFYKMDYEHPLFNLTRSKIFPK
jgi:hypothetical protein